MSRLPQACCHTSHNTIISPFVTANPNFRRLIRDILQNPLLVKTPHLPFYYYYSNPSRVWSLTLIQCRQTPEPLFPLIRIMRTVEGPFVVRRCCQGTTFGSGDSNQVNMNRRQSTIASLQQCDKWNWIARRIMSSLYACRFFSEEYINAWRCQRRKRKTQLCCGCFRLDII